MPEELTRDQLITSHYQEKGLFDKQAREFIAEANSNGYWIRTTLIGVATVIITLSVSNLTSSNPDINKNLLFWALLLLVVSIVIGIFNALANIRFMTRIGKAFGEVSEIFNRGVPYDQKTFQKQLDDKNDVLSKHKIFGGIVESWFAKLSFYGQIGLVVIGLFMFLYSF